MEGISEMHAFNNLSKDERTKILMYINEYVYSDLIVQRDSFKESQYIEYAEFIEERLKMFKDRINIYLKVQISMVWVSEELTGFGLLLPPVGIQN